MRKSSAVSRQVVENRAAQIVEKLRRYHAQGAPRRPEDDAPLSEWMLRWNVSLPTVCKIRAFAKGYTKRELEELCALRRNGMPFNWGYVSCFLGVSDKRERSDLQKRAADENWSVAEVQAEVKRLRRRSRAVRRSRAGPPRRAGRPLRAPADRERALRRLALDLGASDRRLQQLLTLWEGLRKKDGKRPAALRKLLAKLQAKIGEIAAKTRELQTKLGNPAS